MERTSTVAVENKEITHLQIINSDIEIKEKNSLSNSGENLKDYEFKLKYPGTVSCALQYCHDENFLPLIYIQIEKSPKNLNYPNFWSDVFQLCHILCYADKEYQFRLHVKFNESITEEVRKVVKGGLKQKLTSSEYEDKGKELHVTVEAEDIDTTPVVRGSRVQNECPSCKSGIMDSHLSKGPDYPEIGYEYYECACGETFKKSKVEENPMGDLQK